MDEVIRVAVFIKSMGQFVLQVHTHEGTELDQKVVNGQLDVLTSGSTVPPYPFDITVDKDSLEVGKPQDHILIDGKPSGDGKMRESAFTGRKR